MAQSYPFLVTEFEKFIKRFFKDLYDTSTFKFQSSGDFFAIGYSAGALEVKGDSRNEWVVPFYVKENQNTDRRIKYWIGISLQFPTRLTTSEPDAISLRFFCGDNAKDISMIFRAELDNKYPKEHGQPHWHFHLITEKEESIDGFENFDNQKTFEGTKLTYGVSLIKNFHFCMAWNTKGHSLSLKGQTLNWMKEIIEYTKSQLVYIHKRTA